MKLASTCYKATSGSCVKVFNEDGTVEIVQVDCNRDRTVEEVIIEVMKITEIPLTALPYLTLTKTKNRKSANNQNGNVLKTQYGLPFFSIFSANSSRELYLLINTSFLPEYEMSKQVLGQRGVAMVIHQVLSDLGDSPPTSQLAGILADDVCFQRRNKAIIAALTYLSSLRKTPPSPDKSENDDKESFLSKNIDKDPNFRKYCLNFHNHVYRRIALFRNLLGKERSFVRGLMESVGMYSSNITLFWEQINDFNSELHPLAVLQSVLPSCKNINPSVLCAQLDEIEYVPATQMMKVSYFEDHCIYRNDAGRISPAKMAYVARYLSIWNPDVQCVCADEDVKLTPRLLQFCRNFRVNRPAPRKSTFCKALNEEVEYEISKEVTRFKGTFALVLQRSRPSSAAVNAGVVTSDFFSTDLLTLQKRGGENGEEKVLPEDVSKMSRPAGFMLRFSTQQKTAVLRPPPMQLLSDDRKEGFPSKVSKCRKGNNEFFARKELKADLPDMAELCLNWRSHLEKAFDFYDPAWLLHPVHFLDTAPNGSPIAFSPWLELGSLHDLLVDRTADSIFSFRHLLQLAAQLGVALAYLNDALQMKKSGIHPRNVLVTRLDDNQLQIRLAEPGTLWFPGASPLNWHESPIGISQDHPNILPVLQTLYLTITWARELDENTTELWNELRNIPDCFALIGCARRMLKQRTDEELNRALVSSPTKSPSLMNPNCDAGYIVKNLKIDFVETKSYEKRLGEGNSAAVYLVHVNVDKQQKRVVAVKVLNKSALYRINLGNEIKIHRLLDHKHIIRFLDASPERNLLVTEYANRDSLLKYVRGHECSDEMRRRFCREICEGMHYLHSRKPAVIHRDLACRNILLHAERGERDSPSIKITDFGLSRIPEDEVYYRQESSTSQLPILWLPHKDIENKRITKKLDVYSFGVCLWEIYTCGLSPWAYFKGKDYKKDFLPKSYDKKTIPDSVYNLMLQCWQDCDLRPSFEELRDHFAEPVPVPVPVAVAAS